MFAYLLGLGDACFAVSPLAGAFVSVHFPSSSAEEVILWVHWVFSGGV